MPKLKLFPIWQWMLVASGGCLVSMILIGFMAFLLPLIGTPAIIGPTERGVVISPYESTGIRAEVLSPGYYWLKPGEQVQLYSTSQQTYTMSAVSANGPDAIEAQTSDGQMVAVSVSITYAIDPNQVVDLYVMWHDRYQAGAVRPLSRQITRTIIAQYDVEQVLNKKRVEIQQAIFEQLSLELAENHLLLSGCFILDINQTK